MTYRTSFSHRESAHFARHSGLFLSILGCTTQEDTRPDMVKLHYMYFSLILCIVTLAVVFVVSLL